MKVIDIRIEVPDELFGEAWNVAHEAAHGIGEDMHPHGVAVAVFDSSDEAES